MIKSNTSHIRVRRHYTVMACHVPWELRRAALLHRALGEVASDCWSFSCSKNVFERVEMHFEADMRDVCLTDAPAMKLSVEAPQHGGGAGPWAFELDKNRRLFDPTEARLGWLQVLYTTLKPEPRHVSGFSVLGNVPGNASYYYFSWILYIFVESNTHSRQEYC